MEIKSNIPKAPFIEHFFCWVRGVPFGTATDTLALPDNAKEDLEMSSHASLSDDEVIDFNPPANSTGGEMSLADQLAAQANRLKPAGSSVNEPKPVQKPASEMTLAE